MLSCISRDGRCSIPTHSTAAQHLAPDSKTISLLEDSIALRPLLPLLLEGCSGMPYFNMDAQASVHLGLSSLHAIYGQQ